MGSHGKDREKASGSSSKREKYREKDRGEGRSSSSKKHKSDSKRERSSKSSANKIVDDDGDDANEEDLWVEKGDAAAEEVGEYPSRAHVQL